MSLAKIKLRNPLGGAKLKKL